MKVIINNLAWLKLADIDQITLHLFRNELTIIPKEFKTFNQHRKPIYLYAMTDKWFGMPRPYYFSRKHMLKNPEEEYRISQGVPLSDLERNPTITLRPDDQEPMVQFAVDYFNKYECAGGAIEAWTSFGKCWQKGTKVLMFNGTFKYVEDIVIGDKLMGMDSTPRNVLALSRGKSEMFHVIPHCGESFVCTGNHLLTLITTNIPKSIQTKLMKSGEIIDISVLDYLKLPGWRKHLLKLFKIGVNFPEKKVPFDPYIVGVWLGDGSTRAAKIHNPDSEIIEYIETWGKNNGYLIKKEWKSGCWQVSITKKNPSDNSNCFTSIREMCLNNAKEKLIPNIYLLNSREIRLRMLAGLLDTDGHYVPGGTYEITTKYKILSEGIVFLARSLGFYVSIKIKHAAIKSINFEGDYYRIHISGKLDEIPCLIIRKKARKGIGTKRDANRTGFKIEPVGIGDYYGFELDGDNRHLLADFLVVHNSYCALEIVRRIKLNTLIILHRDALLEQWEKAARKFFKSEIKIGRVQGTECDYVEKDITFAMVQTLMSDNPDKFPKGFFEHFGMVIADEAHIMAAEKFGSVLPKFANRYTLLVSGTLRRQDGCENVFKFCGGNTIYKVSEKNRIKPIVYVRDTKYLPSKGCGDKIKALAVITDSKIRNENIAIDIIKALKADRNPLVMSERLEQLKNISIAVNTLAKKNFLNISQGFYIGGKSDKQLQEASECDVVYATIQLAKEGVDIPRLDCLFLASPLGEVEQLTGRVVRFKEGKKKPFVIDYVDLNISCFKNSFISRYKLYTQLGFEIHGIEGKQFEFLDYIKEKK